MTGASTSSSIKASGSSSIPAATAVDRRRGVAGAPERIEFLDLPNDVAVTRDTSASITSESLSSADSDSTSERSKLLSLVGLDLEEVELVERLDFEFGAFDFRTEAEFGV